jgi:hypothetical protein
MLGKLTSIESVDAWMRLHDPEHPYFTVYHGFQTVAKKPSDIAYRNDKEGSFETALKNLKSWLQMHSANGGQFTIFAKSNNNNADTTGKVEYVELLPLGSYSPQYPSAIAGFYPSVPVQDTDAKITGALKIARIDWEKDLAIKGLQARIQELENEEPEGFDVAAVAVGLAETLINKIPSDTIGRIFENLFSKAEGDTVDKMANIGSMYMQMKMQEKAAEEQKRQAAAANRSRSNHPPKDDDDDDNIEFL